LSATLGSAQEISRHRFCFAGLSAESNTEAYTNSGDPWTFVGDTPELTERIEAKLAQFQPLPEHYAGQFYRLYEALCRAQELPVTLADARVSLELITAMYYSAETGQSVDLPLGTDHPRYASWLPRASA
jgi:predicted dehydrogenase